MDFSVLLGVFVLSLLNLTFVSAGWWGPLNRRVSTQPGFLSPKDASESAPKYKRARPPLNRPRPKTGIHRRTSGMNRDMVHFYLYPDSKDTTYREEIVVGNNVSLSSYRPDYYPIVLIHGYMQNYTHLYPQRTKDAYLRQGYKANIIIVDWKGFSQPGYGIVKHIARGYPKASKQVGRMAKQMYDFLMFLTTEKVLKDPTTAHLVGFGLGAQIAGVTGHHFKRNTGLLLGRITGLDPSRLQYQYTAMSEKLDKSDASFVDVIHTTTAPFGIHSSVGHVDFYPNGGGPSQPGCESLLDLMKDIPGMEGSCAHTKAWEYFTDSIYNKELYGCQSSSYLTYRMKSFCSKPIAFGEHASKNARGDYFLDLLHKD